MNHKIKKDLEKVVDTIDVEDITEKAVFCRCWKSENVCFIIFYLYYIIYYFKRKLMYSNEHIIIDLIVI